MIKDVHDKIAEGLEDAIAFAAGKAPAVDYGVHIPDEIDVKAIRKRLTLSQSAFAERFGFALATIRDWEQGRRVPSGHARAYLMVIAKAPKTVEDALRVA